MSISPKTVREQVTNQLRDELVSGRFEAGTMLRENELASRLGVSRGPIRDAFIQLSYEGYLAYHANRGVMVRHPPNPDDRKFITSLRHQIETYCVEKGLKDISDESVEKVEATLNLLREACDTGDATRIAMRDLEFHEAIMVACGQEDLVSPWRQLCSRMLLTYSRLGNYKEAYQEHMVIFEPFKAKDIKATVAALKANIK